MTEMTMVKEIFIFSLLFFPLASGAAPKIEYDQLTQSQSIKDLDDANMQGCDLHEGLVVAKNTQYSDSGVTIKLIRFQGVDGKIFVIPTGFEALSKSDNDVANSMINIGEPYFIRFTACGSGGFLKLIDLYKFS